MFDLTIAIGDLHGMFDEFIALLNACEKYAYERKMTYKLVFLGDYIDRGPGSAQIVQHLINLDKDHPDRCHFGRGNHEQMLMDTWSGGYEDLGFFIRNGGDTTLYSYNVESTRDIPFSHKSFYRNTKMFYEDKFRYFTHAGVNPYKPLDEQTDEHRLWIREPFLEYRGQFPKLIVHGHTPRNYDTQKYALTNRLNMDFGCVFGGKLVAAVFNNEDVDPQDFIAVEGKGRRVIPQLNADFD